MVRNFSINLRALRFALFVYNEEIGLAKALIFSSLNAARKWTGYRTDAFCQPMLHAQLACQDAKIVYGDTERREHRP